VKERFYSQIGRELWAAEHRVGGGADAYLPDLPKEVQQGAWGLLDQRVAVDRRDAWCHRG
jgi:hypothetical protein